MRFEFDKVPQHLEIERRYLLAAPPPLTTPALAYARPLKIVQTQLRPMPEYHRPSRVRKTQMPDGGYRYHWAAKERCGPITKLEAETEIDERTYKYLLRFATRSNPLVKTRWKFQTNGTVFELDHIREPVEQWILEVELEHEDQQVIIPAFLNIETEILPHPLKP